MSSPVEPPSREVGYGVRVPQILADPDAAVRPARVPPNPASVKINVEGAFIVDEEINGKSGTGEDGVHYEHKDIRLPHHTAVVSHVAVDVSNIPLAQRPPTGLTKLCPPRLEAHLRSWSTFRANQVRP
jgi:hypothetical protein